MSSPRIWGELLIHGRSLVHHRAWVLLGMRHASDPDHVIVVSTIVSRQHDFVRSALIGAFWGVGHTLTILVVGAVIILFNLVIPPRIGLGIELSVG
jgi:high-affinity nickel-transport protein